MIMWKWPRLKKPPSCRLMPGNIVSVPGVIKAVHHDEDKVLYEIQVVDRTYQSIHTEIIKLYSTDFRDLSVGDE